MNTITKLAEIPFSQLALGQAFRLRIEHLSLAPESVAIGYVGKRYFKTSADTYGVHANDPLWVARDINFPCEVEA